MSGISPWEGRICSLTQTVARHMKGYSPACPGLCFSALLPRLSLCEKALAEYLDMKRLAFPRFYFVSSADLLDILSNGTNPQLVSLALCHLHIFQLSVQRHLSKLFDNLARMKFQLDSEQKPTKVGLGMYSREEEYVSFSEPCDCSGQGGGRLRECDEGISQEASDPAEHPRYHADRAALQGRQTGIMTICTIDVHVRDVVAKMITQKVDNAQAFIWLSQLRHRWSDEERHCFANICDAQFLYSYEYLGNTPRLVITPLTDRCYITLTQSLHLTMSGAPAGPAGTGKTETTKDLGRALGIMVYVFNCSEQMDYKSCGNIYKGLSQTGAWGCFDEFNRISVEVLSVVAVQVKSVQDAIREKKKSFNFLGEDINLVPSVGIFITMNPGYAGRTELPENLKALFSQEMRVLQSLLACRFRPCAMVVPDFELICEIMLVAEGFIEARALARKFITLYQLCKELLSKQDHYDWGLRAIKSVLVVAGSLKRDDPERPEDQVLMRSLRDFNIPKIVTDDVPVFMGLIGDLFPALDVPRKRDLNFESFVRQAVLDLRLQAEDNFVLKVRPGNLLLHPHHHQIVWVFSNSFGSTERALHSIALAGRPGWRAVSCAGSEAVAAAPKASIGSVSGLTKGPTFVGSSKCSPWRAELHQVVVVRIWECFSQVVKLEELLTVRHSVFVVGDAGTGKSQVMRSLNKTYQIMKRRPVWTDLNPKAVTNDELFGIINPATREWKDGKCLFMPQICR
ncbi:hypothetical protein Q9233_007601 [Columba guinea]|nr:hypothetical protein Q9233_007601 [Columba guinea]